MQAPFKVRPHTFAALWLNKLPFVRSQAQRQKRSHTALKFPLFLDTVDGTQLLYKVHSGKQPPASHEAIGDSVSAIMRRWETPPGGLIYASTEVTMVACVLTIWE
jgi:hypothetical protein